MFIKTFKTSKAELIVLLIGLICFIATLWYICTPKSGAAKTSSEASSVNQFLVNARTASDREQFLSQFGWEIDSDPIEAREITIPADFGEVYAQYNEIQKTLGFDLTEYKGCRVKKWVYAVNNYPGIPHNVNATLLIRDGQVIGGDISSTGGQKFTHSLLMPSDRTQQEKKQVSAGDK